MSWPNTLSIDDGYGRAKVYRYRFVPTWAGVRSRQSQCVTEETAVSAFRTATAALGPSSSGQCLVCVYVCDHAHHARMHAARSPLAASQEPMGAWRRHVWRHMRVV